MKNKIEDWEIDLEARALMSRAVAKCWRKFQRWMLENSIDIGDIPQKNAFEAGVAAGYSAGVKDGLELGGTKRGERVH